MNIADHVARGAARHPHQCAVRYEGGSLSYAVLEDQANAVAAALLEHGVVRGDRVALILANEPAFVQAYLGSLKIGAVPVTINPAFKREEVQHILGDSGAQVVFAHADHVPLLSGAGAAGPRVVVICEGTVAGCPSLAEWLASSDRIQQVASMASDDPALLLYSSGTTGSPKGVVLTHGNLVTNVGLCQEIARYDASDRITVMLPLFHVFAQTFLLNTGLLGGATLVLFRGFAPEAALAGMKAESVTWFHGVPAMFGGLLAAGATSAKLPSLRRCFSAASAMNEELARRWSEAMEQPILIGYGLTEITGVATFNPESGERPTSIGVAVPQTEIRIVDEEDREVPRGHPGEVVIRGPSVMKGYWRRPEETASTLRHGWLHTGDVGRMDAAGYVYLVDRLKDVVNVGGMKVWPAEVERVLRQHPAVRDAAVYAMPEAVRGEKVRAAVVLRDGAQRTPEVADAIVRHCREHLAAYKVPESSDVLFLEKLPTNATNKVLKRELRERDPERSTTPTTGAATADPLADCVFSYSWLPQALTPRQARSAPRAGESAGGAAWLVLCDQGGFGAELAHALLERGEACVSLAGGDPRAIEQALGNHRCLGVVDCLALDRKNPAELAIERLGQEAAQAAQSAADIAQSLLRRASRDVPRVLLVTRGAQRASAADAAPNPVQAAAWGALGTLMLEYPELRCAAIDLPADGGSKDIGAVIDELLTGENEERVALRAGGRQVARLIRSKLLEERAKPRSFEGSWLCTGADGGLGLALAEALVELGARHLILAAGAPRSEAASAAIARLERAGASVRWLEADFARGGAALEELRSTAPALRGVIHVAGGEDSAAAAGGERAGAALASRVLSTWRLHQATRGMELDAFLLCNAFGSQLGMSGRLDAAATSAFCDALADARAAGGAPCSSVGWGPIKAAGGSEIVPLTGATGLERAEVRALLARLLERPLGRASVARWSLRRWLEAYPQAIGWPLFTELDPAPLNGAAPRSAFRLELDAAPEAERTARLESHLVEHLQRHLGGSASRIHREAPFGSLGLDSLGALELRNRLEASLGLNLPPALFFLHPSVSALAVHLSSMLSGTAGSPQALAPAVAAEAPAADLDALDDQALLAAAEAEIALATRGGVKE